MYGKYYYSTSVLLTCLIFSSCKTSAPIQNTGIKTIPQSYSATIDSTNSAETRWKDLFSDKNLVTIIDSALKNNLDLLSTLQRLEKSKAEIQYRKGLILPILNGVAWGGQERTSEYSVNWAGNEGGIFPSGDPLKPTYNDYYLGFQSSWEVDVWGKLRNSKRAAFTRYLSSVEGKNFVITNLVAEIATTYYELLSLDNQLKIIRESLQLQKNALEVIKIQKQAGTANELAVKQFEAEVFYSQSLEFETLQNITENENKLNFLLGRFPQPIIREEVSLTDQIPPQIKTGIPSQLLKNRPDIKQAEFELMATKFDVKVAKAAFYPSFNISGSIGLQAYKTAFLLSSPQSLAYNLLGGLATPLLNRSAIKAQFSNAKANQIEAMLNYQKSILNGFVEVSNELSSIKNLEQIYERKTKEVEALTKSIDISTDLFKAGKATYFEVLLIQNRSLQSKLDLINTKKRQSQATVNIYKALGGGWR